MPEGRSPPPYLYILSFDRWGDLISPNEVELAVQELSSTDEIERIIILSYGWNNERETSFGTYRELLGEYLRSVELETNLERTAILAISWDASLTGFRKLFNDLLPLPLVADVLALGPDLAMFPLSFWSKAAMADRIGYGGLRPTLNEILDRAYADRNVPPIYLVGHSFGSRVLSGLVKERLWFLRVRAERFSHVSRVRGALMIQPAAVGLNLPYEAHYPVIVSQTQHDHANGFLFPIANLPWSAVAFSTLEGVVEHGFFDPTTSFISGILNVLRESPTSAPAPSRPQGWRLKVRRGLAEVLTVPFVVAFSALLTPVNYGYAQVTGLSQQPVDHLMDTLAQIPIIEVPVSLLGSATGRETNWGARGKGFFNLGAITESAGRLSTPAWGAWTPQQVYSLQDIERRETDWPECGFPRCRGLIYVDAADKIRHGIFGENLRNPVVAFSLGWLDPIGAHNDYRQRSVFRLLHRVIRLPDREVPEQAGTP